MIPLLYYAVYRTNIYLCLNNVHFFNKTCAHGTIKGTSLIVARGDVHHNQHLVVNICYMSGLYCEYYFYNE